MASQEFLASFAVDIDEAGVSRLLEILSRNRELAESLAAAQITQNNHTVSAPVNIHVTSSGANAERIGQSLYDTAERYLLKTLEGAMA